MKQAWTLHPLGDAAIVIEFGNVISEDMLTKVQQAMIMLEQSSFPGLVECVPSYTTLAVYYDPAIVAGWGKTRSLNDIALDYIEGRNDPRPEHSSGSMAHPHPIPHEFSTMMDDSLQHMNRLPNTPYDRVCALLDTLLSRVVTASNMIKTEPTVVEIPVCYGGEYGPDLAHVAAHNGLTEQEVIALHSGGDYLVYTLGFAPGFPYLGGLSDQLTTPRRDTPRIRIPAGSVGIAGIQTGIYPLETPGGWQLIGRTPISLFRPHRQPPTLLSSGNRLVFRPISEQEYMQLQEQDKQMNVSEGAENATSDISTTTTSAKLSAHVDHVTKPGRMSDESSN
ncbi:5-oxoprolinase subunit PxpB [Paenibacillus kandeliae]|uniref:5-oxoprolinase subunit PxpB n=1 Tax=Paenibacillus kandeliae TaxID=3231269 RepID=UPI0034596821